MLGHVLQQPLIYCLLHLPLCLESIFVCTV